MSKMGQECMQISLHLSQKFAKVSVSHNYLIGERCILYRIWKER